MSADGDERRRPAPVGDVIASVLARAGLTTRVAQASVIPEWPGLVGPQIARVTEPMHVQQDGVLVVAVRSSAWMQELSLLAPELLRGLNRDTARPTVTGLRWVLQRDEA